MGARVGIVVGVGAASLACGGLTERLSGAAEEELARELAEQLAEGAAGADVELDADGTVRVEGPDGTELTVGDAVKPPEGWPADVPILPSAELRLASCAGAAGQPGFSCLVSGETTEGTDAVLAWYEGQLSGWTKTTSADLGTATMTTWTRGADVVALSLTKGEPTVVAVTCTKQ